APPVGDGRLAFAPDGADEIPAEDEAKLTLPPLAHGPGNRGVAQPSDLARPEALADEDVPHGTGRGRVGTEQQHQAVVGHISTSRSCTDQHPSRRLNRQVGYSLFVSN